MPEVIQAIFVAVAGVAALWTVIETRAGRSEEIEETRRRDRDAALREVGRALIELDEAATLWQAEQPGGHLFEPAQTRLTHALGFASVGGLDACWELTGGPAETVEEKIGEALIELIEARDTFVLARPPRRRLLPWLDRT